AKQAVHGWPGARHVGPKCTELLEPRRERRGSEIVWWKRREIPGGERLEQVRAALLEAGLAVEAGVHRSGRLLGRAPGHEQDDAVVAGQLERLERRAVPRAELRAEREKERNVGAERRGELVEALLVQRIREPL